MVSRRGRFDKLSALVFTALIAIFIAVGGIFGVQQPVATFAQAAPYYVGDKKLDFVVNDNAYVYTYDNKLSFADRGAESPNTDSKYVSGDFYSDSSMSMQFQEGNVTRIEGVKPASSWNVDLPIDLNGDLAAAVRDNMVSVKLQLYFIWDVPLMQDGGGETCIAKLTYYNGETREYTDPTDGSVVTEKVSLSAESTVNFPADGNSGGKQSYYCEINPGSSIADKSDAYVSLSLSGFTQENMFSVAFREVGIKVTCSPREGISLMTRLEEYPDSIRIINAEGLRHPDAPKTLVKGGDIVVLKSNVNHNGVLFTLDTSNDYNAPTSPDGRFYRRLFLREDNKNATILKYTCKTAEFERIYNYSYVDEEGNIQEVDLSGDYSGQTVAFRVKGATVSRLELQKTLWRGDGLPVSSSGTIYFDLDNSPANPPYLDGSTDFVKKYIGATGKSFYTNRHSYETEDVAQGGGQIKKIVTAVNLGKGDIIPQFTADSLNIRGVSNESGFSGASQIIYYKATRLDRPPSTTGERSDGFAISEGSPYCTVEAGINGGNSVVTYSDLRLDLKTIENGETVYNENGIYSIEFMTVDYAGNSTICPSKYFIRVDVADYEFSYSMSIGSGDAAEGGMSASDVTVTFATIGDDNTISSYSSDSVFKRGDRVIVKVKFTRSSFAQFVLTNFKSGTDNIAASDNSYDNSYATVLTQSASHPYSFEVSSYYSDNADNRKFYLTFKRRAVITAGNLIQTYNGSGRSILPQVVAGGSTISGTTVTTVYATSPDGPFSSNLPVDAGIYYYKCELLNHKTYYGRSEGTFEILPANPVLQSLTIYPIDYGAGLKSIDFDEAAAVQQINGSVLSLNADGKYYSDRSADGVYGYYVLTNIDKNGNAYLDPNAGVLSLTVQFVPIKWTAGSEGEIIFTRINGKFVRDNNYSTVNISNVTLTVRHSKAVDITVNDLEGDSLDYDYDGSVKRAEFTLRSLLAGDENLPLSDYAAAYYRLRGEEDYVTTAPSDAGVYDVVIRIQSARCNYEGEWNYVMTIHKRGLTVECAPAEYEYQSEKPPVPTASYGFGANRVVYDGLNYRFDYFYYAGGGNLADSATDALRVPEGEFFKGTAMPEKAGVYVVKMTIDERNFENSEDAYSLITIKKAGTYSTNLSMTVPTVGFNSVNRDANISYMQPLKNIVLDRNVNTGVKFVFHVMTIDNRIRTEIRSVEGSFIVAGRLFRAAGHEDETVEEFVAAMAEYSGFGVGRQPAYIYFVPSGDAADNFELLYRETEIVVGRAELNMDAVTVEDIVYGYVVDGIEDLKLNGSVRVLISGAGATAVYRALDAGDDTEGYDYSLDASGPRTFDAGTHYIDVRVTPRRADLFAPLTYSCILNVKKKTLGVTFDPTGLSGGFYRFTYGGVQEPTALFDGAAGQITGKTAYFLLNTEIPAELPLRTGEYTARYEITEPNYQGSGEYNLVVDKDVLTVSAAPKIYEENTAVSFNRLMSEASFYGGVMLAGNTGAEVSGAFRFDYDDGARFTDTGVRKAYKLKFVPADTENYEIYAEESFVVYLTVAKADIGSGMTLEVAEGLVYGDLAYDFDLKSYTQYSTPVFYRINADGIKEYSEVWSEGFQSLPATIEISGRPHSGLMGAGSYVVRVSISDDNYSGTVTGALEIAKKRAVIDVTQNEKIFSNKNQNVSYALKDEDGKPLSETVVQTFYLGGVRLTGAPSEIGKYRATLALVSGNYTAEEVNTDFTIKVDPAQIRVTNTEQVYNIPRAVAVSLGLNTAVFTLSYYDEKADVEYATLPVNAGEYRIVLTFAAESNDGYSERLVYSEPLVISKYTAGITVNDYVTTEYTGRSYNIRAVTAPYGLELRVEYCAEGSTEFLPAEALEANSADGYHMVRFTVVDDNYRGEKTIFYKINPAALTVVTVPQFNTFTYNGTEQPGTATDGRVDFGVSISDIDGIYALDLAQIGFLPVGTHRVSYTFIATDEHGRPDGNFLPVRGVTELSVEKRAIAPEEIILGEESGSYARYNGGYFSVDAAVDDALIYDGEGANADFRIVVYYNGNVNLPREPGAYTVRAVISSKNYTGERTWEQTFTVDRGVPEIAVPPRAMGSFAVGDTVTSGVLSAGSAVVAGTDTRVSGEFSVAPTQLDKANYNDIEVTFTPVDGARFTSVSFTVTVFAEGENPLPGTVSGGDWSDAEVTVSGYGTVRIVAEAPFTAEYGTPLSEFTLKFVGDREAVAYLNGFGLLTFADRAGVPEVGDAAEVVFTPYGSNADVYSIVRGFVAVDVVKAELAGAEISLKGYAGEALSRTEVIITDGSSVLSVDGILSLYTDEGCLSPMDMSASAGAELHGNTVYYRYESRNYRTLEGAAVLSIVNAVSADNIEVGRLKKSYDGKPLTAKDLDVSVINVSVPVTAEDITLRIYADGKESDGTDVGVYTVVVYVENVLLYGTRSVVFTVNKRDVSGEMELSAYSSVFSEVTAPSITVDGTAVPAAVCEILFKRENASDASYNRNLPVNTGRYNVKAVVNSENYSGERVFLFTVDSLSVKLSAESVYTYDYGKAAHPGVGFRSSIGNSPIDLDYLIYYYSDTYSMSVNLPENAGSYTARVVLSDGNYTLGESGYAEFSYVINRMSVAITAMPDAVSLTDGDLVYNLKYGQTLAELSLAGGEATRNDSPVGGIFSVSSPSVRPDAGQRIIEIRFTPNDGNYSEAYAEIEITVAPADAAVVFDVLQTAYTGTSRASALGYRVEPAGVRIDVGFVNSRGETLSDPVAAGSYTLRVTSADGNYRVTSAVGSDGVSSPVFVVAKASVSSAVAPRANAVTVGDSLIKSSLVSGPDYGLVYYRGFVNAVAGAYSFVESSFVFMTAGEYEVDYKFIPSDSANFAEYYGVTQITVNKATATIEVSNNRFVYSEGFRYPTFTTNPAGLRVEHNISFNEYDPSSPDYIFRLEDIIDMGVYEFEAWVADENYSSQRTRFVITISQKNLDMDFVAPDGSAVLQYNTTYGKALDAKIKLYPAGTPGKSGYLLKDEYVNGVHVAATYEIRYRSAESGLVYDSHVAPTDIGTYTVSVSLTHLNYTASKTVLYKVGRGIIENVFFDSDSLEKQVYGSVSAPIITTRPANVSYYIVYQGGEMKIPSAAGSYNIIVYFNDDNFEKKQVSAMFKINKKPLSVVNIQVSDKVYDGVATLSITGALSGVLLGDEVNLTMTAETVDRAVNVGEHYVDITGYTLTGLMSGNYDLTPPVFYGQISIKENKVASPSSPSFITSASGFNEGTTVEFHVIDSAANRSNLFEKLTGRTSTVIGYTVKENGADTIIKNTFKVYVAIPERFLDSDFEVVGVGALEGQNIPFTREGNYITFQTSVSGQVMFKKTEFRYEFVVIVAAIAIVIVGIAVLIMINPLQNRRKVTDDTAERQAAKRIRRGY